MVFTASGYGPCERCPAIGMRHQCAHSVEAARAVGGSIGAVVTQLRRRGVGLQVAKCPVCGPAVAGFTIGEAGIMAVERQLPRAPVLSVLDANISAEHHVQEAGQPTQQH